MPYFSLIIEAAIKGCQENKAEADSEADRYRQVKNLATSSFSISGPKVFPKYLEANHQFWPYSLLHVALLLS